MSASNQRESSGGETLRSSVTSMSYTSTEDANSEQNKTQSAPEMLSFAERLKFFGQISSNNSAAPLPNVNQRPGSKINSKLFNADLPLKFKTNVSPSNNDPVSPRTTTNEPVMTASKPVITPPAIIKPKPTLNKLIPKTPKSMISELNGLPTTPVVVIRRDTPRENSKRPDDTPKNTVSEIIKSLTSQSFDDDTFGCASPLPGEKSMTLKQRSTNPSLGFFKSTPRTLPRNNRIPSIDLNEVIPQEEIKIPTQPLPLGLRLKRLDFDNDSEKNTQAHPDSTGEYSTSSSNPVLSRSDSSDTSFTDEDEEYENERQVKLRRCIEEVYATEETYVKILYSLSVKLMVTVRKFCENDDESLKAFNDVYRPLLGTIQSIYNFHHDTILPSMEKYITPQSGGNMWTLFESYYQYIEVMYRDYYTKYQDNHEKIEDICRNNKILGDAMLDCQTYMNNLYPLTQLNVPNQRLLRYILCMKTYMKHLGDESAECRKTRQIHDELDRIAQRCEEALVTSLTQLNELSNRLDDPSKCIKEHRQLIWHGKIKKQSPRRKMDIVPRYLIVFSDIVLVCSEESDRKLDIRRELSIDDLTVEITEHDRNSNEQMGAGIILYPFRVNAVEKSYEFLVEREVDRDRWIRKLKQVAEDFQRRNEVQARRSQTSFDGNDNLGLRAPIWVNDIDVTRCQVCHNRFRTGLRLQRHHCRACGLCVCGDCSSKRLVLQYCQSSGESRVCDNCYTCKTKLPVSRNTSTTIKPTRDPERTIIFGDFIPSNSNNPVWIALQEDFILHVYAGKLDQAEEYCIKLLEINYMKYDKDTRSFTFTDIQKKQYKFIIEANQQSTYPKNDLISEKISNSDGNLSFIVELWKDAINSARKSSFPIWYTRKRDSADSGVSNIS